MTNLTLLWELGDESLRLFLWLSYGITRRNMLVPPESVMCSRYDLRSVRPRSKLQFSVSEMKGSNCFNASSIFAKHIDARRSDFS